MIAHDCRLAFRISDRGDVEFAEIHSFFPLCTRRVSVVIIFSDSIYAMRADFFDVDADDDPLLVLHLFLVVVPVFVLAAHLLVPVDQGVHGFRLVDDFGRAVDLHEL